MEGKNPCVEIVMEVELCFVSCIEFVFTSDIHLLYSVAGDIFLVVVFVDGFLLLILSALFLISVYIVNER